MKKLLFLISFVFLLNFTKSSAFAEKINIFDVKVIAHKNGSMDVLETINYDFESAYRHGIFRNIPLYSKVGDLYRIIEIKNVEILRDGLEEKFEATKTKEAVSFKIGKANKEITGEHIYKISYQVINGIGSNFDTHDEIYWNATGNGWEVVIDKASITFDTDFGLRSSDFRCFTGVVGSVNKDCLIQNNKITSINSLNAGQGLTAVAKYPKGTFPASTLVKELPKTNGETIADLIFANLGLIWLILNIILPIALIIWYQKHKNKKRFGPPVVNFDLPKDEKGERIPPAIAGTIDSAKLERDDVVATLFDLAIRRYIKLDEIKTERKILPDMVKQRITKLKDGNGLNTFEQILFNRLFKDGSEYVFLDELKKDFYKTFQDMENEAFNILVQKKYFTKNPKIQKSLFAVFGIMAIFTSNVIVGLVLILLAKKLNGRTSLGDELDYKIDGLKLFLKSMNRNYKWQAEKFYTVEAMIPYAMSLGYIEKFMEQLKIIKPDYNPSWYGGYRGTFYTSYAGFYSSMSSNVTTSAPSSSSGFSGGSSGGGGGGGGGGSW